MCRVNDCLLYKRTLDDFLTLFPRQDIAESFDRWASDHTDELQKQIRAELALLMEAFYTDRGIDRGLSARVDNPSITALSIINESARVVMLDGQQATLQLWCDVSFEADMTFAVGYAQDPVTNDLIGLDKKTIRDNMSRSGWVDILLEAPGNIGKAPGFHVEKICLPCDWVFFYPTR